MCTQMRCLASLVAKCKVQSGGAPVGGGDVSWACWASASAGTILSRSAAAGRFAAEQGGSVAQTWGSRQQRAALAD